MPPTLGTVLLATTCASLAAGFAGLAAAVRARAALRAGTRTLSLIHARDAGIAEAGRRLARAARDSAAAVRDELARSAAGLVPAIDGVLFYADEGDTLRCIAAYGDRFAYFPGAVIAKSDQRSLVVRALASGHRAAFADGETSRLHPGDAAVLAVPLSLGAGSACVLAVASQHAFEAAAVERIVVLAADAAPAYSIAIDREDDRRRAEYDGLTGLLTPRAFRHRLGALVERARFSPYAQLALVFADTDHFKRWNDNYGHPAGDALLRELAEVLRSSLVPGDIAARNGGDEFCLVFAETGKAAAIERAERLRLRIAGLDYAALRPAGSASEIRVTASLGVAAFPSDALTASELLELADSAMYHAKATGRDGLCYRLPNGDLTRFTEGARSNDEITGRSLERRIEPRYAPVE